MRPFNLSEWIENPSLQIVTRDGRPARILDYNLKGYKRICIAIDDKIQESITTVDENGHSLIDEYSWHESKFDLFFADEEDQSQSIEIPFGAKDSEFIRDVYCIPEGCEARIEGNKVIIEKVQKEEELTEFEKAIYIDICTIVTACNGNVYGDKELKPIVKGIAKDLLDLARKELESERDRTCEEAILSQVYSEGYEQGKQDTLKDLPKWKKSTLPIPDEEYPIGFNGKYFCYKGYCVDYEKLFEILPKEEETDE